MSEFFAFEKGIQVINNRFFLFRAMLGALDRVTETSEVEYQLVGYEKERHSL